MSLWHRVLITRLCPVFSPSVLYLFVAPPSGRPSPVVCFYIHLDNSFTPAWISVFVFRSVSLPLVCFPTQRLAKTSSSQSHTLSLFLRLLEISFRFGSVPFSRPEAPVPLYFFWGGGRTGRQLYWMACVFAKGFVSLNETPYVTFSIPSATHGFPNRWGTSIYTVPRVCTPGIRHPPAPFLGSLFLLGTVRRE